MRLVIALTLALALLVAVVGPERLWAQIEGERGIAPLATSTDIHVSGVEVDVTGRNANEARTAGWKLAQRLAWEKINGPKLSDEQIDSMVSAVVIEQEQIGPRRYVARLGVIFDRARAGQFVSQGEGALSRSAPLLVLPVLHSGGVRQVFEVRNPWQRAWATFQAGASPIDYVRPVGAGGESLILTAGQAERRSRLWWRNVLDQFGAADVIVPTARLERQWPGGPVHGTFTARYGPDNRFLDSFSLTAPSEKDLPAMLDKAVLRIDMIYRGALASGLLTPDPTLMADQRAFDAAMAALRAKLLPEGDAVGADKAAGLAPVPTATQTAAPAAISTITVQFTSPDAAAVDAALTSVRAVPGVQGAATTSLAIGGTSVMRVAMAGDINALAAALRARGWQVVVGDGALSIRR